MPGIGDQHKPNGAATSNPFEDNRVQTSPYTAAEIATLQARLDKQLGPEFISSRPGASGQKVHYLAGEKVINLANEVFGFNGWSSAIQNIQIDFVDEHAQTGRISLGLSVIVRVTLKDGTYHEDVGYGHIENCKGKAAAFAKAKKEGTTDALKRALRTFGKVLGNCIYDQDFLARVTKMKVGNGKWDENELHRHSDFAPHKKEVPTTLRDTRTNTETTVHVPVPLSVADFDIDDTFDLADFDDAEFGDEEFGDPDQIALPDMIPLKDSRVLNGQQAMAPPSRNNTPSKPPDDKNGLDLQGGSARAPLPQQTNALPQQNNNHPQQRTVPPPNQSAQSGRPSSTVVPPYERRNSSGNSGPSSPVRPSSHSVPQNNSIQQHQQSNTPLPSNASLNSNAPLPPAAFYSARAATEIDAENKLVSAAPTNIPKFNPHAESPSIRKTAGVDHRKSIPLRKDILSKEMATNLPGHSPSRDFIDPRSDQGRRVGLPGQGIMNPMHKNHTVGGGMGTSAYRPPSRRAIEPAGGAGVYEQGQGMQGGVDKTLAAAAKRPPLSDVSNVHPQQHNYGQHAGDGGDLKRMKFNPAAVQPLPGHEPRVGNGPAHGTGTGPGAENGGRPG